MNLPFWGNALIPHEDKEIRCPRLGHNVSFNYCELERIDKPCAKCLDCWDCFFDVRAYFSELLSEEAFEEAFHSEPKPKIASLIELIEKAKKTLPVK